MNDLSRVKRLSIAGMSCAGCVATVENALKGVPGVDEATVNLAERTATVKGAAETAALVSAVKAAGYDAAVLRGPEDETEKEAAEMSHYRRLLRKFLDDQGLTALELAYNAGQLMMFERNDRLFAPATISSRPSSRSRETVNRPGWPATSSTVVDVRSVTPGCAATRPTRPATSRSTSESTAATVAVALDWHVTDKSLPSRWNAT